MEAFVSQLNVIALGAIVIVVGFLTYRYTLSRLEASVAAEEPSGQDAKKQPVEKLRRRGGLGIEHGEV